MNYGVCLTISLGNWRVNELTGKLFGRNAFESSFGYRLAKTVEIPKFETLRGRRIFAMVAILSAMKKPTGNVKTISDAF